MTPWHPLNWGVKKFDLLKIHNGTMSQGVMIPWCPMYRGVVFFSLNLQSHATAFKETLSQTTVL